jgi:putative transposase
VAPERSKARSGSYRCRCPAVQIEARIVSLKKDKPSWGAPKIREKLNRLYPDVHTPAISTVHAVLDRHNLVKRRRARRNRARGTALSVSPMTWCADYKGEFTDRVCCPLPGLQCSPFQGHDQ